MINIFQKKFRYSYFYVTIIIAALNAAVFFLTSLIPDYKFILGLNPYLFLQKRMYWQIFTYMFVHSGFKHLILNMFGLVMFGLYVEKSIGSKEFLLYYVLCGLLSGILTLFFYVLQGNAYVNLIGASGAVFAVLFAFAVIFPKVRVLIFGIIPVPGPVVVLIYSIIELSSQVFGFEKGIAHMAHLFGFGVAWVYFIVRFGVNPIRIWIDAFRH